MKNWSLNKKIWSIVFGLSLAFVVTVTVTLNNLINVRAQLNDITGNIVKADQQTSEIRDNLRRITSLTLEAIVFEDPEKLKQNHVDFEDVIKKQEGDFAAYKAIAPEKGQELLKGYLVTYEQYIGYMKKVRELGSQNKNKEASEVYIEARDKVIPELRKYIGEMNALTANQLAEKSKSANEEATRAILISVIIFISSVSVSLLIAYFVLKALSHAISDIVKNLADGSLQVTSAASQIASASEELSQSATEQAASLEQTAASVEEMNSMIAKNTENANSTAALSQKSADASNKGQDVVGKMIQAMSQIDQSNATIMEQVNVSNQQIAGIVKVVEQIAKKTQVINEIVNKTELLSFNASVEAARAGEHGKGFAVVAEEVGNLARMSGAAAEEISTLIEGSIENVNKIVQETATKVSHLIEEGKKAVEEGTEVANECGDVLKEIVGNVKSVSSMSDEIASASSEQARGINEITKAMGQLDQMTQQNAATSEECASAAEELSAQADALKNTVAHLVLTVQGSTGGSQDLEIKKEVSARSPEKRVPLSGASVANAKVVKLKAPRPQKTASAPALKKASGEAPSYDSDGFSDV